LVVWTFVRFAGHELKRRRHFSLLQFFVVVSGGAWVESSSRFVPGAVAPRSGVYRVHHYAHRMPHLVTVIKGMTFPECQRGGDKVRFFSINEAAPTETDVDLARRDFVA